MAKPPPDEATATLYLPRRLELNNGRITSYEEQSEATPWFPFPGPAVEHLHLPRRVRFEAQFAEGARIQFEDHGRALLLDCDFERPIRVFVDYESRIGIPKEVRPLVAEPFLKATKAQRDALRKLLDQLDKAAA